MQTLGAVVLIGLGLLVLFRYTWWGWFFHTGRWKR